MTTRRLLLVAGAAAAIGLDAPATAQPREFPDRAVRIVVPNPPGGLSDTYSRLLAAQMSARWSQPVVVENRPGGGGVIAAEHVARAAPDGHTLVMGTIATHALTPVLFRNPPYDPAKDFVAVALVAEAEGVFAVHPAVPARNMAELIAHMRATSPTPALATAGVGTAGHLGAELFKSLTGLDRAVVTHYRGAAPMLNDMLAGHIRIGIVTMQTAVPHVQNGGLRGLAVVGDQRSTALPDLPTVAQAGLPGFAVNNWIGLFAPAGTPPAVVARINAEVVRTMQLPEVQQRLPRDGSRFWRTTPAEFAAFVAAQTAKWGPIARAAGARID
ncbi:MAG TPA: tripartite tricarboxylate transporter substrate binding protein [Falsiroseomonas sp.]|jgi:tripartite-type tricarboxylate transporter receptor subunit TctC|nr:tripartite tricarboxylate transporter substrate binding protein [Falsiroseomonas sp.]